MADTPLVVLGVDPGSQRTGWGIIAEQSGVLRLVDCGIIRTTSSGEKEFSQRLAVIYRQLADVVGRYRPQEAAIEQVFTAKNAASALKLGQARGVAVAACAAHRVPVSDYEPTLVKNPWWAPAARKRNRWPSWCGVCSTCVARAGPWTPRTPWPWPSAI